MLYWLSFLIIVMASIVVFKRINIRYSLSLGIALGFLLSIISMICLSQNYTISLIGDSNDGIGISNFIAYAHIGEDGWTVERFKAYFDASIYTSLSILLMLLISLVFETIRTKKK